MTKEELVSVILITDESFKKCVSVENIETDRRTIVKPKIAGREDFLKELRYRLQKEFNIEFNDL